MAGRPALPYRHTAATAGLFIISRRKCSPYAVAIIARGDISAMPAADMSRKVRAVHFAIVIWRLLTATGRFDYSSIQQRARKATPFQEITTTAAFGFRRVKMLNTSSQSMMQRDDFTSARRRRPAMRQYGGFHIVI